MTLVPDPSVVVIFGANGDLAQRKLLPGLYRLHAEGWMAQDYRIIGNARREVTDEDFRALARKAVDEFGRVEVDEEHWRTFAERLSFVSGEFAPGSTDTLTAAVEAADQAIGGSPLRLFYLSTPPSTFGSITLALGESGLTERARVVYEKPFGMDVQSFEELDATVHDVLSEDQIYRIDHFLGKESVQNILALRFANGMFEAMWNRNHIDHVQIDVPETLSIGSRAGFYEKTGALRDMLVTHLFQVLSVVAMEPPARLEPDPLINEKTKIFESMRELTVDDVVLGQYDGYRDADGVAPDSITDTFVAARVFIDNWRWDGVPFYLRTGKCMPQSRQTITLAFRNPPMTMFGGVPHKDGTPNDLVFELSGNEGVRLEFLAKEPGPGIQLGRAEMDFTYAEFDQQRVEAYERLIHDALLGDRTLFTRADGIGRTWEVVSPIVDHPPAVRPYARNSWGPEAADDLIAPRRWRLPDGR
jgi:glucose-6-phosphate 1-dehydrogenase